MIHELARILGLTDASGGWYLWWSGVFGDVTIFAAALIFLRHKNCHTPGCWRLGHADADGVLLCHHHRST